MACSLTYRSSHFSTVIDPFTCARVGEGRNGLARTPPTCGMPNHSDGSCRLPMSATILPNSWTEFAIATVSCNVRFEKGSRKRRNAAYDLGLADPGRTN